MPITLVALNYNTLDVAVPVLTTLKDLSSMFCRSRGIGMEVVDSDSVFIYNKASGYSSLAPESSLLNFGFEEHTRLDLPFIHDKILQSNCFCFDIECRYTEQWQELLWMETDDWGVRNLFETFAYGDNWKRDGGHVEVPA
jgi:uncharacterized ubiquitin-like protein YukD